MNFETVLNDVSGLDPSDKFKIVISLLEDFGVKYPYMAFCEVCEEFDYGEMKSYKSCAQDARRWCDHKICGECLAVVKKETGSKVWWCKYHADDSLFTRVYTHLKYGS